MIKKKHLDWEKQIFNTDSPKVFLHKVVKQTQSDMIGDILPDLYKIWASIPLTRGTVARKMIGELIDRLEKVK